MLAIPAIDLINNSVVRLEKGLYESSKSYNISPVEMAQKYDQLGFKWLHIVDLMGSKDGEITTQSIIDQIKSNTNLKIEFGGGIRSYEQIVKLCNNGIDKVIVGSLSVTNQEAVLKASDAVGSDRVVVAADVLNEVIKIKGWTEDSAVNIFDHIEFYMKNNLIEFLCTDISKDGMLSGPSFELYSKMLNLFPGIKLIASGGISCIEDVEKLNSQGCYASVVGKSIYEGKIKLEELAKFGS